MYEEITKENSMNHSDVLESVTVIYTDGIEEHFGAGRITEKGFIIVRMIKNNGHEECITCGHIPIQNIKYIIHENKKRI